MTELDKLTQNAIMIKCWLKDPIYKDGKTSIIYGGETYLLDSGIFEFLFFFNGDFVEGAQMALNMVKENKVSRIEMTTLFTPNNIK